MLPYRWSSCPPPPFFHHKPLRLVEGRFTLWTMRSDYGKCSFFHGPTFMVPFLWIINLQSLCFHIGAFPSCVSAFLQCGETLKVQASWWTKVVKEKHMLPYRWSSCPPPPFFHHKPLRLVEGYFTLWTVRPDHKRWPFSMVQLSWSHFFKISIYKVFGFNIGFPLCVSAWLQCRKNVKVQASWWVSQQKSLRKTHVALQVIIMSSTSLLPPQHWS